jgi:hypothetical protein
MFSVQKPGQEKHRDNKAKNSGDDEKIKHDIVIMEPIPKYPANSQKCAQP